MKKHSQEYVSNYYRENGYILSSIYKGNNNKDSVKCPKGHQIEIKFSGFQQGNRCPECAGNIKLSQETVSTYYKQFGYLLKSTYKCNKNRDDLMCPVGHDIKITLDNFKRGNRCAKCSGLEKFSQEHVFDYYKQYNYTMKSIYKNSKTKNEIVCPNGHEIEMTFDSFKCGHRCYICSGNSIYSQEFVFNYYKQYNYVLNSIYTGCNNKDNLICPNGHEIKMRFSSFKIGYRCQKCAGLERHSQDYVENYYKENGYILKSIYKNCDNKDKLICPNKHLIYMSFYKFKNIGNRCNTCYRENNFGENHSKWNKDRTRIRRSKYLSFNIKNINVLKDDLNYDSYLNNKEYYSVDHIHPRIAFIDNDFDKLYDKQIIKEICNLRENLRIIPKELNGSKGGKYNQEEFMNWFNSKVKEK